MKKLTIFATSSLLALSALLGASGSALAETTPTPEATDHRKMAVPVTPSFDFPECGKQGTLNLPEVEGVAYAQIMDSGMGHTTIRATPLDGYYLVYADGQEEPHVDFWVQYVADACPVVTDAPFVAATPPTESPRKGQPVPATETPVTEAAQVHSYVAPEVVPNTSVEATLTPVASATTAPVLPEELAYTGTETGSDKTGWTVLGGLLILLGVILVAAPKMYAKRKH